MLICTSLGIIWYSIPLNLSSDMSLNGFATGVESPENKDCDCVCIGVTLLVLSFSSEKVDS